MIEPHGVAPTGWYLSGSLKKYPNNDNRFETATILIF